MAELTGMEKGMIDAREWVAFRKKFNKSQKGRPNRISKALSNAAELVVTRAKVHYLTGAALKVDTGRLRASVTKAPASGAFVKGKIFIVEVGTNVSYGRTWELGFSGNVSVKPHSRLIKKAFGKSITPKEVQVKAHTRNVNMKARPWLGPSFRDRKGAIEEILKHANAVEVK